jgi:5,5'-dehydrodivanillate O-demethylase
MASSSAPARKRGARIHPRDFAHTGPGTPAGRFLRTFWHPVYIGRALPAGHAKPLRIMSEDYTLYRGETGEPHLVDFRCAHRGTQLSTGWVEGDCIRCFYHGWKYDATGQCVEQPAEDASFASKVRIKSYPVREYLGLIWAYVGEAERGDTGAFRPPPFRRYPYFEEAGDALQVGGRVKPLNYFNEVENSIDVVHVGFVHGESQFADRGLVGIPTVWAEESDFGLNVYATRENDVPRLSYLEMPTTLHIKIEPLAGETGWRDFVLWRVPIDDDRFATFFIIMVPPRADGTRPRPEKQDRFAWRRDGPTEYELGEAILAGKMRMDEVDRTLIISVQDHVAQRGQGIIADRDHERLGRSDASIILLRQIWAREIEALLDGRPLKQWCAPPRLDTTVGL